MIKKDRDSLACDLAEVYQIFDMHLYSPQMIAVFSYGLGEDSRIFKIMRGCQHSTDRLILAGISDSLSLLVWSMCSHGAPKPVSLLDKLLGSGEEEESNGQTVIFESADDFERTRLKLMGG